MHKCTMNDSVNSTLYTFHRYSTAFLSCMINVAVTASSTNYDTRESSWCQLCRQWGQKCNLLHPWWRHQMKHFPRHWPFVRGIHRSPVNSPHKGQWRGALMFSLISAWINGWVNNGEAGDLRRHLDHYGVTVMASDNEFGSMTNPDFQQIVFQWYMIEERTTWDVEMCLQMETVWSLGRKNALVTVYTLENPNVKNTVLGLRSKYSWNICKNKSMSLLLMPWHFTSPEHQQPWCWT